MKHLCALATAVWLPIFDQSQSPRTRLCPRPCPTCADYRQFWGMRHQVNNSGDLRNPSEDSRKPLPNPRNRPQTGSHHWISFGNVPKLTPTVVDHLGVLPVSLRQRPKSLSRSTNLDTIRLSTSFRRTWHIISCATLSLFEGLLLGSAG